jgi:choline dehydrogenase
VNHLDQTTFDYIIVGAGTAGCLLANRLSANPKKTVLLLEAGPKDNYPWIHIPVGYLYCIGNPRTDWMFQTQPEPGLNGRQLIYPRGKTLGGCSSINGMIYMRGQARDYDDWASTTGEASWSWQNALPDFMAHEDHYRLDAAQKAVGSGQAEFAKLHGNGGEWRVEKQRLRWDILEAFADAATQAGIEHTDDFNTGDNAGVGYFEVNQKSGWRWNASKAFLRPIQHRRNLRVLTQAQVAGLTFESINGERHCTGVQLGGQHHGQTLSARAQVILCAGAIGSPQLLQVSGLGPAALLQQCGVPMVADVPGVGQNLQDHLQIRAVFKVQGVKTLNTLANSLWGKAMIGMEYLFKRSGPMSMSPSQLGAFTRSDPGQRHANLQYHVQPLSLNAFGEDLHRFPAFTASVCNLNPSSRGSVNIRSANANDAPLITPNYLSTDDDRLIAAASLRQVRSIASQPALARFAPQEWKPGAQYQSDDELARLAGDIASTIFHPVGTAKMGRENDPMAVVDPQLRVRGVRKLRVVDASIMPSITSGNTNAPTLMIAEKAARWILNEAP